VTIKTATCYYLVCDGCGKPVKDEWDGVPHFDSVEDAQKACLGEWNLAVVVYDQHFCHDCKTDRHVFVAGKPPIEHLCLRCDEDAEEHEDQPACSVVTVELPDQDVLPLDGAR
jgi:hypothetical protein